MVASILPKECPLSRVSNCTTNEGGDFVRNYYLQEDVKYEVLEVRLVSSYLTPQICDLFSVKNKLGSPERAHDGFPP